MTSSFLAFTSSVPLVFRRSRASVSQRGIPVVVPSYFSKASTLRPSLFKGLRNNPICSLASDDPKNLTDDVGSLESTKVENGTNETAIDEGLSSSLSSSKNTAWDLYVRLSTIITNLFPLWTLLSALAALKAPALFTWLTTPYFTFSLGMLMLSMGITLSVDDFRRVLRRFGAVTIGFLSCYIAMPLLALLLTRIFALKRDLAAGMILIGAVNGGQASNLCTYIANGNVALSVMMTTTTTLGAIFMTPLISKLLIGTVVPVNAVGIAFSTIQVVLLPIALGMFLNQYANRAVRAVLPFSPVIGVIATCLLVGSSVAQCAGPILQAGMSLQIPILLLHLIGGVLGYFLVAIAGYGEIVRRTAAIETAMKSSAFSFLLASLHFGAYLVRVPSAVSVVWMSLVGSSLAVFWRYVPVSSKVKFDRSLIKHSPAGSEATSNGSH